MKQIYKEFGAAWVAGFLLPAFILGGAVLLDRKDPIRQEPVVFETKSGDSPVVSVLRGGSPESMELDGYLTGVVLAEMPASFEMEALKAQAVVARTYTLRSGKHEGANVCTDSKCCQGYISVADYLAAGGRQEDVDRVASAVQQTEGLVLTYEGELIEATYFSCSGGSTEDALAVWGTDVAYLQATASPGEEYAAHYRDTVEFSTEEFASKLGISPEGDPGDWIGQIQYTDGGGIDTVTIAGKEFTGVMLRQLLQLRSTACTFQTEGDTVRIITRGYGHRVGMSQYGADAMAASGSTFDQILAHYYQGTALENRQD